jgi:hypothetical protein
MKKITTADCKKLLVNLVSSDPTFITSGWNGDPTAQKALTYAAKESNWKREWKVKAANATDESFYGSGDGYYTFDRQLIPFDELSSIRCFVLSPDYFDTMFRYLVLEDKNGKLHLGENVSD